ncbi:hypothetical protein J6590_087044 [Homalodisca vitripennis]|nr:hypothetical protein J6590_087044 [Homalodisca vitripennis]
MAIIQELEKSTELLNTDYSFMAISHLRKRQAVDWTRCYNYLPDIPHSPRTPTTERELDAGDTSLYVCLQETVTRSARLATDLPDHRRNLPSHLMDEFRLKRQLRRRWQRKRFTGDSAALIANRRGFPTYCNNTERASGGSLLTLSTQTTAPSGGSPEPSEAIRGLSGPSMDRAT